MAQANGNGTPDWEERMQAIRETLELVAGMQMAGEKEMGEMRKFITNLALIAQGHERRIADLEEGKR